jgi:recombination protein RecT
MTRRSMTASFAPGAYVFPGGGIDAADAQAHDQSTRGPTQSDLHLTQAIAAIRESFEELGILLARRADGSHLDTDRLPALDRKAPFAAQCAAQGLTLRPRGVRAGPLGHRPRPAAPLRRALSGGAHARGARAGGRRVRAVRAPVGAPGRRTGSATPPADFFIIFPTIRTLERLQAYPTCRRCWMPVRSTTSPCSPVARAPA